MTAVNPIPVVRNNLPEYRKALEAQRDKHWAALKKIDAELTTLDALAKVLKIEDSDHVVDTEYNET